MKAHRHLVAALGMIVFVLIVMMPGVTLTMPSLGAPLLEGTITPTAYVYLPYVAKDYFPSPTPSPTPTVTSTSTATSTATSSPTPSTTPTSTSTNTPTATRTATSSPTPSATPTRTATKTPTATDTGATSVPLATPLQSPTPEPPASPTATTGARLPVVNVPATIAANTTWTAGNVYLVTGQTTVNAGVTLSVEPGAIIKFQDSGSVNGKLIVNGILSAQGTAANRIIFTSVHDDSWGGDTNQNGGATWPTAGDWDGISLGNASGGSILDYTVVTYGGDVGNVLVNGASVTVRRSFVGYGAASGLRWMNGASGQIADNRIEQNLLYGIYLSAASSPVISGNSLAHNRFYAIYLEGNCTPTFSGNTAYGNGLNGVGVFGTVASGAWYPGLPYIATQNLVVEPGSTLTLQPGTVVKFLPNTSFVVRGALAASGTISNPVVFTSINDDSFGGDTHQNGNAVKPNPGDWGTLYFADTSDDLASALDRVVIRYGGAGYNYGAGTSYADLSLDSASPRIANSTFERSSRYGAQFINVSSPQFQGNLVLDNTDHGLWISPSSAPAVLDNSFVRNGGYAVYVTGSSQAAFGGSTAAGNRVNGIGMTGSLNADTTWEYDLPYVVDGSLTLDLSTNLTVQPGIVVKVTINGLFTINGNLSARGTAENRIVFTSLKDDSIAGDTNGDGIATAPVPGDWAGIRFASTASGSDLDFVTVRYAGRNASTGAVFLDGGAPNLGHLVVMGSQYRGLYVQNASPVVENAVFSENATGIYNGPTAYLTVNNSDIYSNTQYGLYNANSAYTVNATNSWWGAATGPTHSSNPGGTGDRVSDGVNYSPYLGAPPVALPPALPGFPAPPTYTQVSGLLTSNTTWTLAQSPYLVVGDVTVNAGVRLTIEPGVVVKFVLGRNLTINGILVAEGTADSRIIFTSIKDDSVGGDANGDGSATWPRPGDWGRIAFGDSSVDSQTRLRYAVVRYGGSGGAGVYVDSASPTIADNLVSQNAGYGLHLRNQSAAPVQRNWILDNTAGGIRLELNSTGSIANNRLWGNTGYAVYMDTSCYPTFSSNEAQYNEVNGVRVSGSVTFNQTWYADLPYVIEGGVTINTGPALTLQPGTIVKFRDTGSSLTVNGALIADGTQTAPIIFTSLRDDAYGGDTDNDDGIYWPEPGDWYRIYFADPSDDGRNILRHVNVRYGGAQSVYVNSAAPRIISNTIAYAGGHGLYLTNQSNSLVQSNTFLQNGQSGLHLTGSSAPTIRDNVFRRNRENAVEMTAESKPRFSGNQAIDNTYNGVKVSGAVAGATTWDDDLTYVAGAVTIPSDASLTLSPGTVVKFLAGANWTINGTLIADGTVAAPIVLTSPKDDAHGGDTNNDSNASVAGPGDWGTIAFASTSANSRITNAFIRYGGNPAIRIDQTAMVLTADVFTRNYGAIDLRTANQISQPLINNTFENNQGYSIWTNLANLYAITPSNTFVNTVGNAVRIDSATLTNNLTLYSGVVYWPSSLTVPQTYTLSIQPGAVVKLGGGGSPCWADLEVLGSLVPQGTVTNPVYITSLRDDSVGGDTNGDGNATSPTPGDWRAIELGNNATATFDYTVVRYGGASSSGGSSCGSSSIVDAPENAVVTLRDSEVSFSASNGIEMNTWNSSMPYTPTLTVERSVLADNVADGISMLAYSNGANVLSIFGSIIRDNGQSGIDIDRPLNATVRNSMIYGNAGFGALAGWIDVNSRLDARYNYWGSEDGPAPYGSGDAINTFTQWDPVCQCNVTRPAVIFSPWLNSAGQVVAPPPAQSHAAPSSPATSWAAEPVNVVFGNYTYQYTDLAFPTRGLDFGFQRTYNSAMTDTGPLGPGWTHSYNITATQTASNTVVVQREDGRKDLYTFAGGGVYLPPPGIHDVLVWATDHFVITTTNQVVYTFNPGGLLAGITDRNGNTTSLTYSGGKLSAVTDPTGRQVTFTYTGNLLTQITDPSGRSVSFGYTSGRLTTVTDVTGRTTTYAYDGNGRLQSITDANGHTFVYNVYDGQGRVVQQRDALNNLTTFNYDTTNRRTTVTDPRGNATVYAYDATYRVTGETDALGNTESYVYDADSNRISATDKRGNTSAYTHDGQGNVLTATDPLGGVTTFTYDTRNNLASERDPRNSTTTYTYDTRSNPTQRRDALNNLTTWSYDAFGQVLSTTDARSNTTRFGYDSYGHQTVITDALGITTTFTYDLVGRKLSERNPLGFVTGYGYDAANRLRVVTDALGFTTVYTYDLVGNRIAVQDALGRVTRYGYDAKDRLAVITDTLGNMTRYTYDANNNQTGLTNALGRTTIYTYDALNRRASATDPLGNVTSYLYDANGNRTRLTDANGRITQYAYDALNRLTSVTDAAGGTVTYAYDAAGNRTGMTDANSHTTTYAYDALNRLLSTSDPLSNTTAYGYDAVGNRTRATQPTGTVITYTYDALNRLSGITSTGLNIAYAYDAVGNRRTMTDTVGVTTYTYDVLNRLTQAAAPNGTLGYGYDANGNRIRLTYPGGQIVTSTYDLANRLTTVTDWAGRVTSYTYDAANRQTGIQYPNSTQATYVYDNADRLLSIRHTSTVSGTLAVFTYTLDAVGNRLSMQDLDGLTSYGYDSLYRLTSVTYPNAEQVVYAYDPMGNRTGMTSTVSGVTTYSYDAADRLLRAGADTFGWDANGRQITRTFGANTATYTFDPLDRLTQVVSGTVTVQFGYDGDGVRTSKTVGSVATQYVQDVSAALPVVVAETTAGQTNRYVYGNDLLEQVSPAGSPAFYHADGLGSTRALSNLSGQRTDAYSYDVFGQVRSRIGSAAQPFAFAGEQTDGELGLVYLRARYYDPQVGRFVTQDTFPGHAREPQTINKYVYASDNPVLVTDPTGLFNLKQFGIGAFDMLRGAGTVATSVVLGSFATGLCATGVGCIAGAPIGAYAANQAFVGGQMIGYGAVELGMGIGKSSTAQVESFEAYDPLRELTGRAGAEIAPHLGLTVEQGRGFGEASKDVLDIAASLLVSKIPGSKADTVAYALWQQGAMSTISRSRLLTSLLVNPLTKTAGDVSRVLKILKLTSSTVYAPDQSMYYHNGGYGWGDPPSGGK